MAFLSFAIISFLTSSDTCQRVHSPVAWRGQPAWVKYASQYRGWLAGAAFAFALGFRSLSWVGLDGGGTDANALAPLRLLEVDRGCDPPEFWELCDFLEPLERCEFWDEDRWAPGAASVFEDCPLPLAFSNVFNMS